VIEDMFRPSVRGDRVRRKSLTFRLVSTVPGRLPRQPGERHIGHREGNLAAGNGAPFVKAISRDKKPTFRIRLA